MILGRGRGLGSEPAAGPVGLPRGPEGKAGRWTHRLTVRFALLSIIPMLALGFVLSSTVRGLIQDRYLSTFTQTEDLSINSLAALVVSDPGLTASFEKKGGSVFASMMAADRGAATLSGLAVYEPSGNVMFSAGGPAVGTMSGLPELVRAAFNSRQSQSRFVHSAPANLHLGNLQVELAVPIRLGNTLPVVVHAYDSAADLDRAINSGVNRANLIIIGGLGLLWLLLFPVVFSASRRLRKQSSDNAYLALHDSLTGLPNRDLFSDRLSLAMAEASRRGEMVGLLLLDLDRFKEVNDGLGHQHGDALLCEVATLLSRGTRTTDTLARLGGDEFGVILTGIHSAAEARDAGRRVLSALESPIRVNGVHVTPQGSAGLALFPVHGDDTDTLLGKADMAMYAAKSAHSGLELYYPERDFSMPAQLGLVTELRHALDNGEIICHYQPLARMIDSTVWGVEALVRWNHPSRGIVSPADFLPVAEQAGLIDALTRRVLHVALHQVRAWQDAGADLVVAVNLSARSLRDPSLPATVFGALREAGVAGDRLELEITEDALLDDPAKAKFLLEQLTAGGIRISLDDFGTGYSSLAYLSGLPVDKVKIDRAFLTELDQNSANEKIVEAVIELGRRLGMDVLAEGVETADVWQRLVTMGCPEAQGYFLARPMPGEEVVGWLADRTSRFYVTS